MSITAAQGCYVWDGDGPATPLRALGWLVVRWSWPDLENPESWLSRRTRAADLSRRIHRTGIRLPAAEI